MKCLKNKSLATFFVIVGTVIGSGFLSGKEIVVFFTRFGKISFLCIFLAFFLFFGLFYFFLRYGSVAINRLKSSKFAIALNILICISLSCAMFAGILSILQPFSMFFRVFLIILVLFACIFVAFKGNSALEKLNLALVPIMIAFSIFNFVNLFTFQTGILFQGRLAPLGIFYCLLYVLLNTANSAIVISNSAKDLSNKQKAQVSFFSALALCLLLLFANVVLLQNSYAFVEDMPLLCLVSGWQRVVMSFVVLLGCCTTLFSLVCTMSSSFEFVCKRKVLSIFLCVFLPFGLSFLGFSFIVSALYPLASVLGCFLLCELFLLPLLRRDRLKNSKKFRLFRNKK